jgi:hypothetical protein
MNGKIKKILLVLILLAAAGGTIAYFQWNKPHEDVASEAGVKTDAIALYKLFTTDSVTAKKNYIQKVVEVSGTVNSVSKNQQNQAIVLIRTAADGAYINCTMEQQTDAVKAGAVVAIKGICNGIGQGDADLGIMGDVYLVRCYLAK